MFQATYEAVQGNMLYHGQLLVGDNNGKNNFHWNSWKKLTQEKKRRLGFKDLEAFNKALPGKYVWRLLISPNLLVSKVMKSKYYPKESIFSCKVPNNASWIWKGSVRARDLIQNGVRKKIGNGKSMEILEDRWILDNPQGKPATVKSSSYKLQKVGELICQKRWNRNLIFKSFNKKDSERIMSIPISLVVREDTNFWIHSSNGDYSVRSGYKTLKSNWIEQQMGNRNEAVLVGEIRATKCGRACEN